MLVRLLTKMGYVCDEASNGVEAVEMIHLAMFHRPFQQGSADVGGGPEQSTVQSPVPRHVGANGWALGTHRNTTRWALGTHRNTTRSEGPVPSIGPGSIINDNPYQCILIDNEMPILDGPGAIRIIRDLKCTSIVYGVTGNGCTQDVDTFTTAGANTVFIKPLDMDAFKRRFQQDKERIFVE